MISRWEYNWCEGTEKYPEEAVGDTYTVALKLYKKWHRLANNLYVVEEEKEGGVPDPDKGKVVFGID